MYFEFVAFSPLRWPWAVAAALAVVVAVVLTAAPAEAAVAAFDRPEVNTVGVVDGGTLVAPLAPVVPLAWGSFDQPQVDRSTPARWSGERMFWSRIEIAPGWWATFVCWINSCKDDSPKTSGRKSIDAAG